MIGTEPSREEFLAIMSAFASGVTIVTTLDEDGQPKGLTTTAFSSVSADPPLVMVCVDRSSRTLPALLHSRRFVVNFIAAGHHELCATFASKAADKFERMEWSTTEDGLPLLDRWAHAWAACTLERDVVVGDHVMLIARVRHGEPPTPWAEPLMYFRRTYGAFTP